MNKKKLRSLSRKREAEIWILNKEKLRSLSRKREAEIWIMKKKEKPRSG